MLGKVDESQIQNLVHDANQVGSGPTLPGLSYQREVKFDSGPDEGWST